MRLRPALKAIVVSCIGLAIGFLAGGINPGNPCKGIDPAWDSQLVLKVMTSYPDLWLALFLCVWLTIWLVVRTDYN